MKTKKTKPQITNIKEKLIQLLSTNYFYFEVKPISFDNIAINEAVNRNYNEIYQAIEMNPEKESIVLTGLVNHATQLYTQFTNYDENKRREVFTTTLFWNLTICYYFTELKSVRSLSPTENTDYCQLNSQCAVLLFNSDNKYAAKQFAKKSFKFAEKHNIRETHSLDPTLFFLRVQRFLRFEGTETPFRLMSICKKAYEFYVKRQSLPQQTECLSTLSTLYLYKASEFINKANRKNKKLVHAFNFMDKAYECLLTGFITFTKHENINKSGFYLPYIIEDILYIINNLLLLSQKQLLSNELNLLYQKIATYEKISSYLATIEHGLTFLKDNGIPIYRSDHKEGVDDLKAIINEYLETLYAEAAKSFNLNNNNNNTMTSTPEKTSRRKKSKSAKKKSQSQKAEESATTKQLPTSSFQLKIVDPVREFLNHNDPQKVTSVLQDMLKENPVSQDALSHTTVCIYLALFTHIQQLDNQEENLYKNKYISGKEEHKSSPNINQKYESIKQLIKEHSINTPLLGLNEIINYHYHFKSKKRHHCSLAFLFAAINFVNITNNPVLYLETLYEIASVHHQLGLHHAANADLIKCFKEKQKDIRHELVSMDLAFLQYEKCFNFCEKIIGFCNDETIQMQADSSNERLKLDTLLHKSTMLFKATIACIAALRNHYSYYSLNKERLKSRLQKTGQWKKDIQKPRPEFHETSLIRECNAGLDKAIQLLTSKDNVKSNLFIEEDSANKAKTPTVLISDIGYLYPVKASTEKSEVIGYQYPVAKSYSTANKAKFNTDYAKFFPLETVNTKTIKTSETKYFSANSSGFFNGEGRPRSRSVPPIAKLPLAISNNSNEEPQKNCPHGEKITNSNDLSK